ncbi:MAG: hypothetical protein DCC67_16805, partial [Planctomycetota bacterium]
GGERAAFPLAAGHEVGSHSYAHRLVYTQTPDEFRLDLRRSREAIGQAAGRDVTAYRAPSFSITKRSLWALEILVEEGFTIDSSVFPIYHDRYGIPDAPRDPFLWQTPSGPLVEFPATTVRWGKLNVPVSGGGYFRLAPYGCTEFLLHRVVKASRPFLFYIHPWEIDAAQPRLSAGSRQARFRHYVNLHKTAARLDRLVRRFAFGALTDALDEYSKATGRLSTWRVDDCRRAQDNGQPLSPVTLT